MSGGTCAFEVQVADLAGDESLGGGVLVIKGLQSHILLAEAITGSRTHLFDYTSKIR